MVSIVSPSICHEVMGLDPMILVFDLFFSQPHFRYCEKEAQRLELLVHDHAVGAGSLHSFSEATAVATIYLDWARRNAYIYAGGERGHSSATHQSERQALTESLLCSQL